VRPGPGHDRFDWQRIHLRTSCYGGQARRTKPETRRRIEAKAQRLAEDLHLSQLRKARGLTQETMADLLGVSQAEVSKIERRTELYVGTLRKFIEAMNGELVIAARFADAWKSRSVCQRKALRELLSSSESFLKLPTSSNGSLSYPSANGRRFPRQRHVAES
jgi:transcriptional regulator with XRE-family HTH domain